MNSIDTTRPNRTATRPAPTVDNARFGDVRADEVRVRDIIEMEGIISGTPFRVVVTEVRWEGDDIIVVGRREGSWGRVEFTTSEGNGVRVVGRA